MDDMLKHTIGLPEIALAPGDTVVREGDAGGGLWILVSGALRVSKGGVSVNVVNRPGAVIGEISLLLDSPYTATVVAASRAWCAMRRTAALCWPIRRSRSSWQWVWPSGSRS
jgi:CRP-like cAMP-binding protein